jgi:hypothetical protein
MQELTNYENNGEVVTESYMGKFVPDIPVSNIPFENINQGTIAVESSRAVAEAQGKLIIAKRFPRDEVQAYAKAIQACQRPQMASTAFYNFPRGNNNVVSGPSIKFAQELARCWGNIDYGIKELSRDNAKSEMQAYAWDMETNTISLQNFTNPHTREVKGKMVDLTVERDIYELNANMAARRLRARILSVLPNWLVDDCIAECKKTLAGQNDIPLIDRVRKMLSQFEKYNITKEMIEKRIGHTIETTSQEEFVDLIGIFNSLKDKQSTVADWFEQPKQKQTELTKALDEEI